MGDDFGCAADVGEATGVTAGAGVGDNFGCAAGVGETTALTVGAGVGDVFGRALGDVFATSGCVDVGEKEGGRLRRTELAERGKRNDQAMMSGVIWSSMKAMRSRNCSLRFFSRCSRSKSGAGD